MVLMVPKFMFAMYLLTKNKWYVCPMVIGRYELRQSAILTLKYIYIMACIRSSSCTTALKI